MSAKEKGKTEDMAKADKARYEREMKTYIPPKGRQKRKYEKDIAACRAKGKSDAAKKGDVKTEKSKKKKEEEEDEEDEEDEEEEEYEDEDEEDDDDE
ncbi:High mobility group protein B1 [Sciurus carolinensis]|uniref:High mobility group protein B1 n=1 Tax=Sciurus carolinensis TaxID=30640 RepID=A0AA41MQC5_SCICA|nr:High mobility group protein B1 [Sciurus carolinensis]